jgi:hypothetical protein
VTSRSGRVGRRRSGPGSGFREPPGFLHVRHNLLGPPPIRPTASGATGTWAVAAFDQSGRRVSASLEDTRPFPVARWPTNR